MLKLSAVSLLVLSFVLSRCSSTSPSSSTPTPTSTDQPAAAEAPADMTAAVAARPPNADRILEMLRDPEIFGPDFPAALAELPAFAAAGEERVSVLPRRVVGRTKHTQREPAAQAAGRARAEQGKAPPMRPEIAAPRRRVPQIDAVLFPDDRTWRAGTEDHEAQYLNPQARIDRIEAKYGKAERVTIELLDDGTERRPIELKLHSFFGGAIVIATSNIHDDPRTVDRVFLDTNAVRRTVF